MHVCVRHALEFRRAFTLIELMVVLAIAAVFATMVLPMLRDDDRLRLIATASLIRADLQYAQAISIATPDNPLVVVFDPLTASYYLAETSDTSTPITRDDTGLPFSVTLGLGRASASAGVTLAIAGATSNIVAFDSHGGLVDFAQTPEITLQAGDQWFKLAISPTTGTITETSGTSEPEPDAEPVEPEAVEPEKT